jgi:hypothetical protein
MGRGLDSPIVWLTAAGLKYILFVLWYGLTGRFGYRLALPLQRKVGTKKQPTKTRALTTKSLLIPQIGLRPNVFFYVWNKTIEHA